MNWTYILLGITLFLCFLNTFFIFFIGVFLVRFKQEIIERLEDTTYFEQPVVATKTERKFKTWDEKYEEDLKILAQKIAEERDGLQDI